MFRLQYIQSSRMKCGLTNLARPAVNHFGRFSGRPTYGDQGTSVPFVSACCGIQLVLDRNPGVVPNRPEVVGMRDRRARLGPRGTADGRRGFSRKEEAWEAIGLAASSLRKLETI